MSNVADSLVRMSREFKTNAPDQAAEIRRAFKLHSKNDCVRTILYLMEVVGSRDQDFKGLVDENKDLKELLKLNNIDIEKLAAEDSAPITKESIAAADAELATV